jgi:hypothetical protein
MDPHNFSIYACGVCGIVMVCGAIWLLKTGVIKLSAAVKGGGMTVELANKVKISTTYPALGLFFIGLLFIALGLWFSKGDIVLPPNRPLAIVGKIHGVDDKSLVTVTVEPDQFGSAVSFEAGSSGQLDKILPDIKQFTLKIAANGYLPRPYYITRLNVDDAVEKPQRRQLNVPDDVKFTRDNSGPITVDAPPLPGATPPVPAGVKLAPFRAAATEPTPGHTESVPAGANLQPSPQP